MEQFSVWADAFSFCFIVYNGHTLCLSNVISPINVSGKFTLENASLYEDLTYCTCTCFVPFHIKCVDMSILLLRGMLNNISTTESALIRDLTCLCIVSLIQLKLISHAQRKLCHRLSNPVCRHQGTKEGRNLVSCALRDTVLCCSFYRKLKKNSIRALTGWLSEAGARGGETKY